MLLSSLCLALLGATSGGRGITANGDLHAVDSASGAAALLGNCGFPGTHALVRLDANTLLTIAGGIDTEARLIAIDEATGAGAALAILALGGEARGLAFDVDGSLLASVRLREVGDTDELKRIDLGTFAVSLVGNTGVRGIEDIVLTPEGTLYAWDAGATGTGGAGLGKLLSDGSFVDQGTAPGDSDVLALTVDEVGAIVGANRKLYDVSRSSGVNTPVSSDTGVHLEGLVLPNAMTTLDGAVALDVDGDLYRINATTGAFSFVANVGSSGFAAMAYRALERRLYALRPVAGGSEVWIVDPGTGAATLRGITPVADPVATTFFPTSAWCVIEDGGPGQPDKVHFVNIASLATTSTHDVQSFSNLRSLSVDSLFRMLAWDALEGLVTVFGSGVSNDVAPGPSSNGGFEILAHDPLGRLFGLNDALHRIHIPSESSVPIGSALPLDRAVGLDFLRFPAFASPVAYCTAQINSLGCEPQMVFFHLNVPSASAGSGFTIRLNGALGHKQGLLFYGVNGRNNAPFLGGVLCVQAPLRRTPIQTSGGTPTQCDGQFAIDFNTFIAAGVDPALEAGAVVNAQWWSRDPAAASTTNLSRALEFEIAP